VSRNTWRYFDYHAHCEDCNWALKAVNALGLAAQHHDRTGHSVSVEVNGHVSYCDDEENERRIKAKENRE